MKRVRSRTISNPRKILMHKACKITRWIRSKVPAIISSWIRHHLSKWRSQAQHSKGVLHLTSLLTRWICKWHMLIQLSIIKIFNQIRIESLTNTYSIMLKYISNLLHRNWFPQLARSNENLLLICYSRQKEDLGHQDNNKEAQLIDWRTPQRKIVKWILSSRWNNWS